MSRQSKNARVIAKRKQITEMHKRGEKGPSRGAASKKKNAWWQIGNGSYTAFIKGKPKRGAQTEEAADAA